MRVSINLLKQFLDIEISESEIVQLIKKHIGEVEYYRNLGDDYKDIVIAEIKHKEDHPDSDRLAIYQIDYGVNEDIQVVAGDKTLEVGDKVAYIKVGAAVPYSIYSEPEPFIIKSIKLRGIQSNGMLGSAKELNVGNDDERVMVLPSDAPIGTEFAKYYELNDTIIEIENKALTNRGDLFGVLGVARELSAVMGKPFATPDWYISPSIEIQQEDNCLKLKIENDAESLCPRYTAIALDNIEIKESPIWLKASLIKCGIKPINNIVDITNYISILIGQPLHAFDYDKLVSNDPNYTDTAYINIRMARHGEKLLGLDEKLYELNENIMVIADSNHPIAIAGVIGGHDTQVDDNTKRIILESANFDKSSVRKTSMQLGIFTDAATRFKHALDTQQCISGLLKAVELIREISDSKVASNIVDIQYTEYKEKGIQMSVDRMNTVLGTNISEEEVINILENLEYSVTEQEDLLNITIPSWRRDINIKEDIYEDIVRIYGYHNVDIKLPQKEIKPPRENKLILIKRIAREVLSNHGANEILTYSFTDPDLFSMTNLDVNLAYKLKNPLSKELSIMRTSLLPSMLSKAKENLERGIDRFALFEMNIAHINKYVSEDTLPVEDWYLSLLLTDRKNTSNTSPYYAAKVYLEELFRKLNILNIEYSLIADYQEQNLPEYIMNVLPMFDPNTSAIISVQGEILGIVGELRYEIKNNFKLPKYTSAFELNINKLIKIPSNYKKYREQPIYPTFIQDLCFEMDDNINYGDIENMISVIINKDDLWGMVECLDIYKSNDESSKKRITYRIVVSNYKKTLADKDIKEIVAKIAKKIKTSYSADII